MVYMRRTADLELDDLFPHIAAIALDSPKAVGKTTTAAQRAMIAMSLDRTAERVPFEADPELLLSRPRPILIDEWQNVPEVWDVVRHAVDWDLSGGQFLLAGSATPRAGATAHSGAGRIGRLRMRPMTLEERGVGEPAVSLTNLFWRAVASSFTGKPMWGCRGMSRRFWRPAFPLSVLSVAVLGVFSLTLTFAMRLTVTCPSKDSLFADRMR